VGTAISLNVAGMTLVVNVAISSSLLQARVYAAAEASAAN